MSEPEPVIEIPPPVATPQEEQTYLQDTTDDDHPDNHEVFHEPVLPDPAGPPEEEVSDEELALIVAGTDPDEADLVGHGEDDAQIVPNDGSNEPAGLDQLPDPVNVDA